MKIVYDNIIFSLQKSGGISVVWYEILKRMIADKNRELDFIEYANSNKNIFRKKLDLHIAYKNKLGKYFLFIIRYINPKLKQIKEPFIFHSSYYRISSNKNAINVTTVHDFIYEKFRKGIRKRIHCFQKDYAIRKSNVIICISENTKKDLLRYYPHVDINKVYIVHNGVSEDYTIYNNINKSNIVMYNSQQYLIYVGVRDEYKRFDVAIKVTKQLGLNLVIIGGGKLSKSEINFIESSLSKNQYCFLSNVSNLELCEIYSNALCLLYPSSYEGFGIPIIEAQKSGCPVVAYNNSINKEIIGNTKLVFDNYDISHIVEIINKNLFNTNSRTKIINDGLINAQKYSWEITYNKTINIYDSIQIQQLNYKQPLLNQHIVN